MAGHELADAGREECHDRAIAEPGAGARARSTAGARAHCAADSRVPAAPGRAAATPTGRTRSRPLIPSQNSCTTTGGNMSDTTVQKVKSQFSPRGEMGQKYLAMGKTLAMRLWEDEQPG